MDKLLSIVVPVYNVQQYIRKCLDSLIVSDELMCQLEVLVVNDGTTDQSAVIAIEYETKYPQTFRVINKQNGGHGSAFNTGLSNANGKYVRFLDSDDWLDKENLSKLMYLIGSSYIDFNPLVYYHENTGKTNQLSVSNIEYGKVYKTDNFDFVEAGNRPNLTIFHNCTYKTEILKPYVQLFAEGCFYDIGSYVGPFINCQALKKVGLVLPEYFIYFDDSEHSIKLAKYGKLVCVPSIKITHDDGVKKEHKDDNLIVSWRDYYLIRNKKIC